METHVSWLTQIVNQYLGSFALSLLSALHIQPSNPATPIPEHVVMSFVVFLIGVLGTLSAYAVRLLTWPLLAWQRRTR